MGRKGPTEGVVRVGQGIDAGKVQISGTQALNRAMHGDMVAGGLHKSLVAPQQRHTMPSQYKEHK